ncbi:MAG TPA: DEAD/DEAH box helicase [Clostridia bacterium]|nr:DEAD/DEAH box helicase [Clostridia bacterium]
MNNFDFVSLPLRGALQKEQITVPTQVQETVIPLALQDKDLIVQSQTGTGKTLAFLLPLFERLNPAGRETQAIILAPTHELAIQIQRQIERLALNSGIGLRSAPIIGNVNILRQIEKLKSKPQIIVGSPGRILELIKKRKISAHTVKTIIVDEADKMLDKNNIDSVRAVINTTLRDRQLLFFSASISSSTTAGAKLLMKQPELIQLGVDRSIPSSIEHCYFFAEERDKIEELSKLAKIIHPEKAMVFINREFDNDIAVEKLKYRGLSAGSLYGGIHKFERKTALENFKTGKLQYLVASDIAARGLQIEGISCVFNISMPEDPLDYLHRAGRTGRNGMQGLSISIITPRELALIHLYEKKFNVPFHAKKMFKGKIEDLKQRGSGKTR